MKKKDVRHCGYWTKERVLEEAKKYETRSEFYNNSCGAYEAARRNNWLDELCFKEVRKPAGYWTYEMCYKAAKECKTIKEFYIKYKTGYTHSCKNGWLDSFDWLKSKKTNWTYERCKEEAIKYSSKSEFQRGCGSAYSVARKKGWINDWFVNKINPNNTWTYERCKEEAMKYDTLKDFREKSAAAYCVSSQKGWRKDFTWLKLLGNSNKLYWTKERCYELALECKTRREFQKKSSKAYYYSRKNGWIETYDWFLSEHDARSAAYKGRGLIWTKDACYEEAKKYKTKRDFHKGSSGAYTAALKNGWLDTYDWFEAPIPELLNGEWDLYVYEDRENMVVYVGVAKCVRRRHRQHVIGSMKKGKRIYDIVHKYFESINKPIPDPIVRMESLNALDAGHYEDWYKKAYSDNGWTVLNIGKTGEKVSSLGFQRETFTREVCYEIAKKYTTVMDFRNNDVSVYNKAHRKGWFNDYYWLKRLTIKNNYYNNYERCKKKAMKYKSRFKFQQGCRNAYDWSLKKGWLDDFFPKNAA